MIDTLVALLGISRYDPAFWMPLVLLGLLFAATVAGAVLDGFDIGVGCLLLFAPANLRARMISLLGPWRDANEFWLFLGLGIFVTAFPKAWGAVMGQLYLPLSLLAVGVLLRSVAFELRLRAPLEQQGRWVVAFGIGSVLTALAHGLLLGQIVITYQDGGGFVAFTLFVGAGVLAGYCLLGATWLIMREGGALRIRAALWGRHAVRWAAAGCVGVSVVLAFANSGVLLKWSEGPRWTWALSLWAVMLACYIGIEMCLQRIIGRGYPITTLPFLLTLLIGLMALGGLGYSFFPYLVLDDITLWDAAASVGSLRLILAGTVVALPVALIFNIWVYWGMFGLSRPPVPPEFKPAQSRPQA